MNCPHCDQEIPNKSEFCIFCGEKIIQKKRPKAIIILSILLAVSLAIAGGELIYILVKGQQTLELIDGYKQTVSAKTTQITNLKKQVDDLEYDLRNLQYKTNFLDNNIAIVPDDGTRLYHKYGCEKLNLSYFWAYNTEAAIDKGYRPCPYCH